jgi:hypothetical protein
VRRRHAIIATLVVGLLAVGAGRAVAAAPLGADEALSANTQSFVNNGWSANPYLAVMRNAGWAGARSDAFWFQVEATKGSFDWTALDAIKARYDLGGVRWQPILEGSPPWARNGTGGSLSVPTPDHLADFAAFAAAFASRYGPGGPMAGTLPVTDIELYNEENARGAGAFTDAASYAAVYRAGRAAIKAVQPELRVVVGAILYDSQPATAADPTPTDAEYIQQLFAGLAGSGADAIALHPYAPTVIGLMANLLRMHRGLLQAGQGGLPIYVNELGYPAALDGAAPKQHAAEGPTTDEARAGTVTFATDALLASDCNVRNVAYFDLVGQESNRADTDYLSSETWKGLERRDGSLTVTGNAFAAAGARWRAAPQQGTLGLCGATAGTPLGLGLQVEQPSSLCLRPAVTYRGFPLEEASVVIAKPDGRSSTLLTDANGRLPADFCVDDPVTFTVHAEVSYAPAGVPRLAQSTVYSCRMGAGAGCSVATAAPDGGSAGGGGDGGSRSPRLSAGGRCLLSALRVTGSRRWSRVLSKGLRLRAASCRRASRGDRRRRQLRVTVTAARTTARRVGLVKRLPKRAVTVASGRRSVTGLPTLHMTARFTRKARRQLRRAGRVRLTVAVRVSEGRIHTTRKRTVTIRR